ncbi:MAG: NAD(+) synthase [Bdellovibrionales bacterium]|nr:NAD(+) synthase [Bdellovibrionales bacterium]
MKTLLVAAAAINQTACDWTGNVERIISALATLRHKGVALACFPELCITGYGCEDAFSHPSTSRYALESLAEILPNTKGMVVNLGLPMFFRKSVYNCTVVIADGEILGVVPKKSLAGDGIHYEPRWFKPWPEDVVERITILGREVPIGDIFFDIGGVRLGFEICEEAWAADRPGRKHAGYGIDIECNPSASHFAFEKKRVRELFVCEGSRAFGCVYIYSNLLGCESGRQIYDGGNLIAVDGEIVARNERFSFDDCSFITASVDIEYVRSLYSKKHWALPLYEDHEACVRSAFQLPESKGNPVYASAPELSWEKSENFVFEEFARAVPFALFDYLRKSYSRGFVVSLSGGCDSSSVSLLVRLGLEQAYQSLGWERLCERLSYVDPKVLPQSAEGFVRQFLTTVWQETENNSPATKRSAKAVADDVGSTHHEISIDPIVGDFRSLIESTLGRSLSYEHDGLVLQNLQARVRNPLPWALANAEGKLLLTTSNRSESALGYCTMDGDTAGGLNPIGGVGKSFLRKWLLWMEKEGPHSMRSYPSLKMVNELTPSAELLPLSSRQSDEGELGPYEVVGVIEELFMRRGQSVVEIYRALLSEFSGRYAPEDLGRWVKRFFELFGRNQWKRERLAPCFHVDSFTLDPKTWCRWPILNGGFQKELKKLDELILHENSE